MITAVRPRLRVRSADVPRQRPWQLVLEPGLASRNYWKDLWRHRELMYFLAWRDVVVRYKQTAIGIAWALLRPALTMLVFVIFRRLAGIRPGGVPEPLLVFTAILPWHFFASALTESSASLIGNASLISKVYFPRLAIPVAAVVASLVDLVITMGLLAILMAWHGVAPGWELAALPFFVLLAFGVSLGAGMFFAAMNVQYRDFRYIVPFVVQFGLFVSPIAFTFQDVPEDWRLLWAVNPMVGIIDGFRWSILGGRVPLDLVPVASSVTVAGALLVAGVWYFRHTERGFADVI